MKPLILIILDGWGHSSEKNHNGIELAKKPHFDSFLKNYPHTLIDASGPAVGLPVGIMGNSEVGHMNLGAGRIVFSGLSQIYKSIDDKSFFSNPALLQAIEAAKKNKTSLHLMGLLSDGAVHSHQDHLYALLDLAKQEGLSEVFIHCFMDGRDTPPQSGITYLRQLQDIISTKYNQRANASVEGEAPIRLGRLEGATRAPMIVTIASISGRYYAMDRDKRWDRVKLAYDTLTGVNKSNGRNAEEIINNSYQAGETDEFIKPHLVADSGAIKEGDAVIFFNFRPDRAREITQALTDSAFKEFKRESAITLSSFVCMSQYDESFGLPIAFMPNYPTRVFAEIISEKGLQQLRIAETEKYAHVTYFFNGGVEKVFAGEDRVLIPSDRKVATYDHKPEMSALSITDEVLKRIDAKTYDVIILNFANADMVGHTAKPSAIIKSVEVIDECLGKIAQKVLEQKGAVLITADHGNAEKMVDSHGNPHTAHTTNLVPFIFISSEAKKVSLQKTGGRLCDVAPTMLKLLQIAQPTEMTGNSLIVD